MIYTKFGETRDVEVRLFNMFSNEEPEVVMWVERQEDYYAIRSGVRTAVVTKDAWDRAAYP